MLHIQMVGFTAYLQLPVVALERILPVANGAGRLTIQPSSDGLQPDS